MSRAYGSLAPDQVRAIDALSLRVLEEVGVGVDSDAARAALAAHGARVDGDAGRVYLTAEVLRRILAPAPARVRFGARAAAPAHSGSTSTGACAAAGVGGAVQPDGTRVVGADLGGTTLWPGNALYLVDGGERRPLTRGDFARLTRLADRLPHVHGMVGVSIADFDPAVRDFRTLRWMARHTGKHLRPVITSPAGIDAVLEMTDILADGADDPVVSFGFSVISPLRWTSTAMTLLEKTSGRGLPFMANAEPLAGATSPVTLAGSLAQAHAETLSGIAVAQALEPGRPCLYNAGFAHTLDMRSAVALGGSPECFLMAAASADLARAWSLPCAGWVSTEAMTEDAQAATEKGLGFTLQAQAGVNLVWGMGQLESQMSISLEQLAIDDEIAAQVDRLDRGLSVDDAHLAADILLRPPGERGDLLSHDHTLTWFRDELSELSLANRRLREPWEAAGQPDLRQRAVERIAELLQDMDAAPPYVTDAQDAELQRIETAWRRQLDA